MDGHQGRSLDTSDGEAQPRVMLALLNDLNFLYVVVKLAMHFLSSQTQLIRGAVLKIK